MGLFIGIGRPMLVALLDSLSLLRSSRVLILHLHDI